MACNTFIKFIEYFSKVSTSDPLVDLPERKENIGIKYKYRDKKLITGVKLPKNYGYSQSRDFTP